MSWKRFAAVLTVALVTFDLRAGSYTNPAWSKPDFGGEYILLQMPELFTYDELVELGAVE